MLIFESGDRRPLAAVEGRSVAAVLPPVCRRSFNAQHFESGSFYDRRGLTWR